MSSFEIDVAGYLTEWTVYCKRIKATRHYRLYRICPNRALCRSITKMIEQSMRSFFVI